MTTASHVEPGDIIRGKWTMDGARTLTQAAERLEAEAHRLRHLADLGWSLEGPVEEDYGFLVDPRGHNGRCGECGKTTRIASDDGICGDCAITADITTDGPVDLALTLDDLLAAGAPS
ncbi:hypothetical protein [Nocardioides pakistanensis]